MNASTDAAGLNLDAASHRMAAMDLIGPVSMDLTDAVCALTHAVLALSAHQASGDVKWLGWNEIFGSISSSPIKPEPEPLLHAYHWPNGARGKSFIISEGDHDWNVRACLDFDCDDWHLGRHGHAVLHNPAVAGADGDGPARLLRPVDVTGDWLLCEIDGCNRAPEPHLHRDRVDRIELALVKDAEALGITLPGNV